MALMCYSFGKRGMQHERIFLFIYYIFGTIQSYSRHGLTLNHISLIKIQTLIQHVLGG